MRKTKKESKKGNKRRITEIIISFIMIITLAYIVTAGTVTWDQVPPPAINCTQDNICTWDFNATSSAGLPINYSLDKPPFSQNIDGTTGILNFTPTNDEVRDYDIFAIAAEVGGSGAVFSRINWTILNTNDPPYVVNHTPVKQVNLTTPENSTFYFNVTASDPDLEFGDYLNYTWLIDGIIDNETLNSTTYEVNYTPDFLSAGIRVIRVNVTDSENETTWVNWTINVTDVNRLCRQNATIPNITIEEDTIAENNFSLQDYFYDPDIDNYPLYFNVTGNTDINISANRTADNNVTLIPNHNFFGTNTVQYRCWDGTNYSNWSNEVVINVTNVPDAPDVENIPNMTIYAGSLLNYTVNASDVDFDTLTYYDNTTLFNINPTTGNILYLPPESDIGKYSINITVGDGMFNVTKVFNLTVKNNSIPVLSPIGNRTAMEASPFTLMINATDADTIDELNFSYTCNNCTGTVDPSIFSVTTTNSSPENATGLISFTPSNSDVGNWSVTYYVNDSRGAMDSETITFAIINLDFDPILDPIPDQIMKVNEIFNLTISATDQDGDIEGFMDNTSLFDIQNTTVMTSPAYGDIQFTPTTVGNYSINISVVDSTGGMDWQQVWFNVTYNRPPTIYPLPDVITTEDNQTIIQANASDPDPQDNNSLIYYDNTTLFDIDPHTGTITFTPDNTEVGNYSINITVGDGEYNDSTILNLTILIYNDFPYWDPPLEEYYVNDSNYLSKSAWNTSDFDTINTNKTVWNYSFWQDNETTIYMTAFDEESTTLGFNAEFINFTNASNDTVSPGPNLFTLTNYNGTTAKLVYKPTNDDVGTHFINLTVNDLTGRVNGTVIELKVQNVNDAPIIIGHSPTPDNQDMLENTTKTFEINATDVDYGDVISYRWYLDGKLIAGATNKNYTYYADWLSAGNRTITAQAYDLQGDYDNQTWTLNITNVNRKGWFGEIRQNKDNNDFDGGNFTNTELDSKQAVTLEDLGIIYESEGYYESKPLNAQESNYFHNFTNISWTGNITSGNPNVTFNVSFQTRTGLPENGDCPTTLTGNYSEKIYTSGEPITSQPEQCIQYRAELKTNDTNYTPTIEAVKINYEIADYEQEQATRRYWVFLKDYFKDPDTDDVLNYTVTGPNGSAIPSSKVNITIDNITSRVTVVTNNIFSGDVYVEFHATDGEYNITSNLIKMTITEIPPIQQPIIIPVGGGGGSAIPQPVEVEVNKYVPTPVSFRLLAPLSVTTYANDTMKIPINVLNNGNFTIQDITLSAETENEYVDMQLSKTKIATLGKGQTDVITLNVQSFKTYGNYAILLKADGEAVYKAEDGTEIKSPVHEKVKIFVNSLLKAKGNESAVKTKLAFAEDLLSSNQECLELNEFIEKAKKLIEAGKDKEATVMLDKIVESCKFLISPKEKLSTKAPEKKAVEMPKQSAYLLTAVSILTLLVALSLVAGWTHMKRKKKEFMRKIER